MIPGPASHIYFSQRLRLHYVDWGNEHAPALLLIHGSRDHCRSWDWVAQAFRDRYHVVAPDLRGHGDSQWLIGSNYGSIDYVYDVAQLVSQEDLAPVSIISHSMGGGVALQYAGIYPERVRRMVVIDGTGPPPEEVQKQQTEPPDARIREWVETMRGLAARVPRRYPTLEAALARLQQENTRLSEAQARHLTIHGTSQNEDGTFSWKFDNYQRPRSPYLFNREEARAFWGLVACPVLLVNGDDSDRDDPSSDGRAEEFLNARCLSVAGAGHWVHHDQLDTLVKAASTFLDD